MSEIAGGRAPDQAVEVALALAAIVESSHDAVIAKDLDGVVTTWNHGATLVYGYPADQMVGRSYETLVAPQALAEERVRHAEVAAGAAASGLRTVRLRADGEPFDVVMSMSPVRAADGTIVGVASLSRPVSHEERDAERYASLLEAAPDAIAGSDANGVIVMANARASEMFGYGRDELVGMRLEMMLAAELRSLHLERHQEYLDDPGALPRGVTVELVGCRRDGSTFPMAVSLSQDRSDVAHPIAIAAFRDLTDQRAAEQSMRETETRLRQLAEGVDTVFLLLQIEPTAYLYISPGTAKVLGVGPDELRADPEAVVTHPEDRDRVWRDFVEPTRNGMAAESEHRIVLRGGAVRWIRTVSTPVLNPYGPTERYLITIDDITGRMKAAADLREAELAARSANAAKNVFLSRMSHELRTPLNAVLGFGQLLELELAGTQYEGELAQILKGGRHLLNLINDVLDVARIEAGEMSISLEPVSTAELVAESIQLMASMADGADIVLDESPLESWHVVADRQRLRQILLNLVSNAIKYNRVGGTVWVEQQVLGDTVAITVRDDGPGIPQALQDRLFTPFDRLGAEATGIDGTGIGLALTRSLAELMGGTVTAESAPGRGSAFTVTLPRAVATHGSRAAGPDAVLAGVSHDPATPVRTLLYVEDNAPNVEIIQHLLRLRPHWRLIHAGLGGLGLDLARANHPDLVLLDLHLPDRSGLDVLKSLKGDPTTCDVPVLILTADATAGQERRLLDAGAARYLTKPLDLRDVLGALDEVGGRDDAG